MRLGLAAGALALLLNSALASDLADDPDAARIEELVRKDDWAAARAIWLRRAADADRDIGRRWFDLDRWFGSGLPNWTKSAHRAHCVAMLAAFLERDRLAEDACRIALELASERERSEVSWWTAITLTRLGRPGEAAAYFATTTSPHAAALTPITTRIAAAPDVAIADRIALAETLDAEQSDGAFAQRAASGMLRRTLDGLPPEKRTSVLARAAFAAALRAQDASDLHAALAAWKAAGAKESDVAGVFDAAPLGGSDPFAGHAAAVAADFPLSANAAFRLARAAARFNAAAAERLFRIAAAHRDDPRVNLGGGGGPAALEELSAIGARRTLARVSESRGRFDEALVFWNGVRPSGECANCAAGEMSERDLGIARCKIALGRGDEVLSETRPQYSWFADDEAERMWIRIRARVAMGRLEECAREAAANPKAPRAAEFSDAIRLARLRAADDVDGLVGELVAAGPIGERWLTPSLRAQYRLPSDDERAYRRAEWALELLREFDGREVAPLLRRLAELPIVDAAKKDKDEPWRNQRSMQAWIVAALANSRSEAAGEALRGLREGARSGTDVGVSVAGLGEALRLHDNDLLWSM